MKYRIEHDSMGELQVPADALWGAQIAVNFQDAAGLLAESLQSAALAAQMIVDTPDLARWMDDRDAPGVRASLDRLPLSAAYGAFCPTLSGNYYQPAFECAKEAMGIDRILLGTDYPYEDMEECIEFVDGLPLKKKEKEMIYWGNAKPLGFEG